MGIYPQTRRTSRTCAAWRTRCITRCGPHLSAVRGRAGIPAAGGLYMLVAQAAYAAALFLYRPDMPDRTDDVYAAIRERKENIVLIGMPGSGKSTLGRLLAARTGQALWPTVMPCWRSVSA